MAVKRLPAEADDRGYVWLAAELKTQISTGKVAAGESLPTTRELGVRHGVSRETARRAIRELAAEGLVASEPRHGYRVQARANDPDRGLPVAFVVSEAEEVGMWDEFHRLLFAGLQKSAAERGWPVLAVGVGDRSGRAVMAQLRDCRACGMVLDAMNADLLAAVGKMGLPAVMMDAWDPEMRLDAVVQDSFQGALLATQHLVGRGHRRLAWLGPASQSVQSRERFGGFCAGLIGTEAEMRPEFMRDTPWPAVPAAARELLSMKDRPTAALGLWYGAIAELTKAASELGLKVGSDIELVGWTGEEGYDGAYRALFAGAAPPTTVVWSVAELARLTVDRLAERRTRPEMPPALIKVPARLRIAGEGKR